MFILLLILSASPFLTLLIYIYVYMCMCAYIYICLCACMYVCIYLYNSKYTHSFTTLFYISFNLYLIQLIIFLLSSLWFNPLLNYSLLYLNFNSLYTFPQWSNIRFKWTKYSLWPRIASLGLLKYYGFWPQQTV